MCRRSWAVGCLAAVAAGHAWWRGVLQETALQPCSWMSCGAAADVVDMDHCTWCCCSSGAAVLAMHGGVASCKQPLTCYLDAVGWRGAQQQLWQHSVWLTAAASDLWQPRDCSSSSPWRAKHPLNFFLDAVWLTAAASNPWPAMCCSRDCSQLLC
jgi:hypothetical protein